MTGRQIEIVGGTRETGRLRLVCPTESCISAPNDWVLPDEGSAATIGQRRSIPVRVGRRSVTVVWKRKMRIAAVEPARVLIKIGQLFGMRRASA